MASAPVPVAEFRTLLADLRRADNAQRGAAERRYAEAQQRDPDCVLSCLLQCLAPRSCPDALVRTQAATLLRRAIVRCGASENAWSRASPAQRDRIKGAAFQVLESETNPQVRRIVVSVIGAIAGQATAETPWDELAPSVFALAGHSDVRNQEAAFQLLAEVLRTDCALGLVARRAELGALLCAGLRAPTPALRAAALSLIAEMPLALDAEALRALQSLLPLAEQALQAASAGEPAIFEDVLEAFIECAGAKPAFFRPRYREWTAMMFGFAGARGHGESRIRCLALEWVSTVADAQPKALGKAVPDISERVLDAAFAFLAEVEADERWSGVDEDVAGDEDDEVFHKVGEEKVDFCVKKFGFDRTGTYFLSLLQSHSAGDRWQDRLAAAMAIRASAEHVTDAHALDTMVALLLGLASDGHMRVRYGAAFALGQMWQDCSDHDPEFHGRWHTQLVPQLVEVCNDAVHRVAAKAVFSLAIILAGLEDAELAEYAPRVVQMLLARFRSCSHQGLLGAAMDALGTIAAGLEGAFDEYYGDLMPLFLAYVSKPVAEAEAASAARLRGKAFECISFLGFSVGKERFAPAAQQAMAAMLATPAVLDEAHGTCMRETMERMCKIMRSDFGPFLPSLMPGVLSGLSLDGLRVQETTEDCVDDELDDTMVIPSDHGFIKVKTGQIADILALVSLLHVFIKETGSSFFDYLRPTVAALAKVLACSDALLRYASSIRDAIYPCWADIVQVASMSVPTRGQEAQLLVLELVQQFVEKVGVSLARAEDVEDIAPMANGIASVVCHAGPGCLQAAQVQGVCDLALAEILKSFQREEALKAAGSTAQPDGGDEDDEAEDASDAPDLDGEEVEEQECRMGLISVLGACIKASPDVFVSHSFPALRPLLQLWLTSEGAPAFAVGLNLVSHLCEHLGSRAVVAWPIFMEAVLGALQSEDVDARNAAAYTILLAAQVPEFGPRYASRAYVGLEQALLHLRAGARDEDAQRAADNLLAALVQLCLSQPASNPALDESWALVFARLPLKVDTEESRRLHRKLFAEAARPGGGALGGLARVAQVLGYLCEVYGRSDHCDEDLQRDICAAFAAQPSGTLQALLSQFSAKQKKKANRILRDGHAGVDA